MLPRPRFGQPDGQQLPLVVPVVERLAGGQPLVALQPHQRRIQHGRERLRRGGLADAGLPFQQQWAAERHGEIQRRCGADVEQVVVCIEPPDHVVDIGRRDGLFIAPPTHQPLVVLPRVDIERNDAGHRHLPHLEATRFDEPPDALVAVQLGELTECVAAQPERMPDPVRVPAHSDRWFRVRDQYFPPLARTTPG